MNNHQENFRNEADKAFHESLKSLEKLWEENVEHPKDTNLTDALLQELAAAAADIENFLESGATPETPESTIVDDENP